MIISIFFAILQLSIVSIFFNLRKRKFKIFAFIIFWITSVAISFSVSYSKNFDSNIYSSDFQFKIPGGEIYEWKLNNKQIAYSKTIEGKYLFNKYLFEPGSSPIFEYLDIDREIKFVDSMCNGSNSNIIFSDNKIHYYCKIEKREILKNFSGEQSSFLTDFEKSFFAKNFASELFFTIYKIMSDKVLNYELLREIRETLGEFYYLDNDFLSYSLFNSIRVTEKGLIFQDYWITSDEKTEIVKFFKHFLYYSVINYFNDPLEENLLGYQNHILMDLIFNDESGEQGLKDKWNDYQFQKKLPEESSFTNSFILNHYVTPSIYSKIISYSGIKNDFVRVNNKNNNKNLIFEYLNIFQINSVIISRFLWVQDNYFNFLPLLGSTSNGLIKYLPYYKIEIIEKRGKNIVNYCGRTTSEDVIYFFYLILLLLLLIFLSLIINQSTFRNLYEKTNFNDIFEDVNFSKIYIKNLLKFLKNKIKKR